MNMWKVFVVIIGGDTHPPAQTEAKSTNNMGGKINISGNRNRYTVKRKQTNKHMEQKNKKKTSLTQI